MQNYKKILPFGLFIIAQSAYDNYAPLYNTNWSIFYFCSQYLAFALLCYLLANGSFWKKAPFYILCLGYMYQFFRNVFKINTPFDEYIISVNDLEANLLLTLFVLVSFTIVVGKLYNWLGKPNK